MRGVYDLVYNADPQFYECRIDDTISFYRSIEGTRMRQFLAHAFANSNDYVEYHKFRLTELYCLILNAVETTFPGEPFTLVEVSTAGDFFARHLKAEFGERMQYVSFNYPGELGGTAGNDLAKFAALTIEADLNELKDFQISSEFRLLLEGKNVIVIASEIVEHLTIDVGQFIRFWTTACAQSTGVLVVTTPNFIADWRIATIAQGFNFGERLVDHDRVKSGHVHVREYTPKECLDVEVPDNVSSSACALSFAMPGSTRQQLSSENYLNRVEALSRPPRVFTSARLRGERKGIYRSIIRSEGLVVLISFGTLSKGLTANRTGSPR